MVRTGFILASLALAAGSAQAQAQTSTSPYTLVDNFDATNFFDEFEFFTDPDPTRGFVKYVDGATANRDGLAGFSQGGVYLGVDYTNTTTTGRASVRVTSKKSYTKGLFIADIPHMPAGAPGTSSCGLWPAFWMFGPNWPTSGEIDIIEGVNSQTSNSVTLHTAAGCSIASNAGAAPGTKLVTPNCQGTEGCSQATPASTANYGAAFNAAGGGVYVAEWTDAAIKVWFFPRGSALAQQLSTPASTPPNTTTTTTPSPNESPPDPSTFGPPLALFPSSHSCSISSHFARHNIVFNTAFCGDWAGRVWRTDKACAALAPRCEDFVGGTPGAFTEGYWIVKGVRVYQVAGEGGEKGGEGKGGRFQGRRVRRGRAGGLGGGVGKGRS
ncbi:glycoside hydrolase [Staphylotrichum tortipilum]|uniref:Glycoside hydrolase n=1 Tax=Staphylotrichum tortipilum TaxID=2831512 RepID=A0AAN6MEW3_9PEZI|nr:glycoside hydrolase [Staphylotrichum longicolle]